MKFGVRGAEASVLGLAIAFFTLAGSQNEPRPILVFGLILVTPLVLVGVGITRRPWLAAAYLLLLGVVIRALYLDRDPQSDVLPVTDAAIDRLFGGGNPYGLKYSVPPFFGPGNPFAYPPGNLFYYIPGFLLDSVRSTEVFSSGVVLAGLAWTAWLIKDDWPVAAMGLYAAAPPLVILATDGSNDTSAGALLFASSLLLLVAVRRSNGWLLLAAGLLLGETLAFKHYTLTFWPFLLAFVAARPWNLSIELAGRRSFRVPAFVLYGTASVAYLGAVCLPFFVASPSAFLNDLTAWSSATIHPIEGWNAWSFLLRWQDWNAQTELGDALVFIDVALMGAAILAGLLAGVRRPSQALLFGAATWFVLMLFARWTTFAYFAGVAPVVLLIPFADRLAEAPDDESTEKTRGAAGVGLSTSPWK
jgi:hypothetical protein